MFLVMCDKIHEYFVSVHVDIKDIPCTVHVPGSDYHEERSLGLHATGRLSSRDA